MGLTASITGHVGKYCYDVPNLPRAVMHLTDILEAFDPGISRRTEVMFRIDASNIDRLIAESQREAFDALEYVDAKVYLGEWQKAIDHNPGLVLHFTIS